MTDIRNCSTISRLYHDQAQYLALNIELLTLDTFMLSNMSIDIPGMGQMIIKDAVQNAVSEFYSMIKEDILISLEQGMTADKEGGIKSEILESSKMFFKDYHELQDKANMAWESMKAGNLYDELAGSSIYKDIIESYPDTIGYKLSDMKMWDLMHKTLMCVYDVITEGEHELAYLGRMTFPRVEVESYSRRLHLSMHKVFSSPQFADAARTLGKAVFEEVQNFDVDSLFIEVEEILLKLIDIIVEIPFEKIIFMVQEMCRNTLEMMIGQSPEFEKFMDSAVGVLMEDFFWQAWDKNMVAGIQFVYDSAKMLVLENGLCGGCTDDTKPFACCIKAVTEKLLGMVEHGADDIDTGDVEHEAEYVRQAIQELMMMPKNMMMMAEMLLEEHMIWCMLEPMVMNMREEVRLTTLEMMWWIAVDGEEPLKTINYVIDNSMEIIEMALGGCPGDSAITAYSIIGYYGDDHDEDDH